MKKLNSPLGLFMFFLAIAGMAYVVYIGRLGFYWDEWPFLWFSHAFGREGILKYFAHNRPYWGYIYAVTMPVLGTNIYAWQIFGLVGRVLSGLALVWVLRLIWPERKWLAAASGLLFILYPGFMQQSIALMYGHFWIVLCFFLVSLGCMLVSLRGGRWVPAWLAAGLLTSAVNLFCMEYFFGLELLRPLILLLVLARTVPDWKNRFIQTIKRYLPYFVLTLLYVYWRAAIFKFPTYRPSFLDPNQPIQSILKLLVNTLSGIWVAMGEAWTVIFHPTLPADFGPRSQMLYWGLVAVSFVLTVLFFHFIQPVEGEPRGWKRFEPVWFSIPALVLAGIPFLLTGLIVSLNYPSDRFTLPYMLGASLLVVALIEMLPARKLVRPVALGILVGFSVGQQFVHTNQYQEDWKIQSDFLWQLTWRAPGIEPGTVVITERLPQYFESDNSLTGPLNWTYAPEFSGDTMPYLMMFVSVRTGTGVLSYEADQPIQQNYKVVNFTGNTSKSLVVWYDPPGCVRVLVPGRDPRLPGLPEELRYVLLNADPSLVTDGNAQPPSFLGAEPEHGWCYYFEKADLAASRGEWQQAAEISDQALASGDFPNNPAERMILAESYAMTGQWDKAAEQTRLAFKVDDQLDRLVCSTWNRISTNTDAGEDGQATISAMRQLAECK